MSTAGGSESTVTPESPSSPGPPVPREESHRPDAGHLDLDAECLEDPVHCGDAHHQHDMHAAASPAAPEAQPG